MILSPPPSTLSNLRLIVARSVAATRAFTVLTVLLIAVVAAPANGQTLTPLYNFAGPPDGAQPYGSMIRDQSGNLYGTTYGGGLLTCMDASRPPGCGVVFKVDPAGNETILHFFTGGTTDGEYSFAPLLLDQAGNLYGTTVAGGTGSCDSPGCGVVFRIDAAGNETVLYNFLGGTTDGCNPAQGVVMDKNGNLYGTTQGCGASNHGTVFKIASSGKEVPSREPLTRRWPSGENLTEKTQSL